VDETPPCKTHPDAPHGFDRNASHSADRYVCECEGWEPPKEWVGLTDEEREQVRSSVGYNQFMSAGEYAKAVQLTTEAKLKEKNVPQP